MYEAGLEVAERTVTKWPHLGYLFVCGLVSLGLQGATLGCFSSFSLPTMWATLWPVFSKLHSFLSLVLIFFKDYFISKCYKVYFKILNYSGNFIPL